MKTLRLLTVVLVVIACALPACAQTQVAAQYDWFTSGGFNVAQPFYGNYVIAQTFVPTIGGTVASIDAMVQHNFNYDTHGIPISFEIRSVYDAGAGNWQPDRRAGVQPLSTGTMSASNTELDDIFINWATVNMTPYNLQAGQKYAIVATALGTDQAYQWYFRMGGSGYSNGEGFFRFSNDMVLDRLEDDLPFRVNVTPVVPEPGSLLALGSGLMGLLGLRLRRK